MSRPILPKGVPDIEGMLPNIHPLPPHDPNVTFAVGDKIRILPPGEDVEKPVGTITKLGSESLRMAFVSLDSPFGSERYVPFGFLEKID